MTACLLSLALTANAWGQGQVRHHVGGHPVAPVSTLNIAGNCNGSISGCQRCECGFDCAIGPGGQVLPWSDAYRIDFDQYAQGEYAGPARLRHLADYRIRPGDRLQFTYILSRELASQTYRIGVGDQLMIESLADPEVLNRGTLSSGIEVQPDGTIAVRILGNIHAAGLTIEQLRELLDRRYSKYYTKPRIDVSPVRTNVVIDDIQAAVSGAAGFNEQAVTRVVTPDGLITLPKTGPIFVHGLSIAEIRREVNLKYATIASGLEIEVALVEQANHFVTVLGEVASPGRFTMQQPTTALTAIALAGGHRVGANLRQVVIFRRADDWRLISTVLNLRRAVLGRNPLPVDEVWLRDGDVVIVPSSPIQQFDNFVSLVFTQGIYGVVPFGGFDLVEAVSGFEVDND